MYTRALRSSHASRQYICIQCRRELQLQNRCSSLQVGATLADDNNTPRLAHSRRGISTTTKPTTAPSSFSSYNITPPPTLAQLTHATNFFTNPPSPPRMLLSTDKFLRLPQSNVAEVAFLGRSNVGKSSLLNALVNREGIKLAHVSGKPGRTRTLNAFAVGGGVRSVKQVVGGSLEGETDGKEGQKAKTVEKWVRDMSIKGAGSAVGSLVVLDMPGYGRASREEWGREIIKYVGKRAQLRRTFVLIDAEHGLKANDLQLLHLLRTESIPHQLVATKVDKILFPKGKVSEAQLLKHMPDLEAMFGRIRWELRQSQEEYGQLLGPQATDDIIACSAETSWPVASNSKIGMDALRWAVLQAVGLDCDEIGNKRRVDYDVLPAADELPNHPTNMPARG